MVMLTRVPAFALLPATGVCATTVFTGIVLKESTLTLGRKPSCSRSDRAWLAVCPVTSGISIVDGPVLIVRLTGVGTGTRLPAGSQNLAARCFISDLISPPNIESGVIECKHSLRVRQTDDSWHFLLTLAKADVQRHHSSLRLD